MMPATLPRLDLFGKSPVGAYLRVNEWLWNRLPGPIKRLPPLRSYGHLIHALVRMESVRQMSLGTFFLRNRPELELIRRVSRARNSPQPRVAVLGVSNGAEAYSIAWAIRSAFPATRPILHAVDISAGALAAAQEGTYSLNGDEMVGEPIFARLTEMEMEDLFDRKGDRFTVKPWIREGIRWHLGDVRDPRLQEAMGPQDIVVANRFLCHMVPADAERCLRSFASLVAPGGYLFVSGVDLDVRTKVAKQLGWKPVRELLEEIHDGDSSLRDSWPCKYWGLEPLDKQRPDWEMRYAAAFQLGETGAAR